MRLVGYTSLLSLFLLSLGSFSAFAGEEIGQAWPKIIRELRAKGIESVGELNLASLATAKVRWLPLTEPPPEIVAGSRSSAYYDWQKNAIYISQSLPAEAMPSLPQLELHELLGLLHYNDQNYALSTALTVLAQMKDPVQLKYLRDLYGRTLFTRQIRMSGGGSSVGGGGDLSTLYIKMQVFDLIMNMNATNQALLTSDFLKNYPVVDFEPVNQSHIMQVTLRYKFQQTHIQNKSYRESFAVYVPMSRWTTDRRALLQEIAPKILAVFPASDPQHTITIRQKDCVPAIFPATQDPAVLGIQEVRAKLLGDCGWDQLPDSYDVIAPTLAEPDLPKTPGQYDFGCTFYYPGTQPFTRFIHIAAGVAVSSDIMYGVDDDDYLSGVLLVDTHGAIAGTTIDYRSPSGERSQVPPKVAFDSLHSQASLPIDGKLMVFDCKRQ